MPGLYCQKRKQFPKNLALLYHKHLVRPQRRRHLAKKGKSITNKLTIWQDILLEDQEYINYLRKEKEKNFPTFECASSFLIRHLFPDLVPAFEKICALTLKTCVLSEPVPFFNFIDALAEVLYNSNSAHKERKKQWTSIHYVHKNEYRPYYPYYLFLTPEEAAVLMQALVRGFLVRRKYNLKEMKEERKKILEGIEKQKRCYNALKDDIKNIVVINTSGTKVCLKKQLI